MSGKTALLIIDPQNDFHEGGPLGVPGALEDSQKIADLINSQGDKIDEIIVTMDSHHRMHISHGVYWKDSNGTPAPDMTLISLKDVEDGKWSPANSANDQHVRSYLAQLEQGGKFQHIIWPEHCLIGTTGHAVVDVLNEALQGWAKTNMKTVKYLAKGMNTQTEMYSPFKAEVVIEGDEKTDWNMTIINDLKEFDQVLICGEARSHCVNFATRDLAEKFDTDCNKLVLLTDGCSNVPSFEAEGDKLFEDMSAKGVQLRTVAEVQEAAGSGQPCTIS